MNEDARELIDYWRLTIGVFVVWTVIDLIPQLHAFPAALAAINLFMLILVAPACLDIGVLVCLSKRKYELGYWLALPAVWMAEFLNLIPDNPFARGLPIILANYGTALANLERSKALEKVARRLMRLLTKSGARPMQFATANILLSTALAQQGRYEESEAATREAMSILESQPGINPMLKAANLADLCTRLAKLGRTKESMTIGSRALAIMEQRTNNDKEDRMLLGMTLNNLGVAFEYAGLSDRALECYRRSLDLKAEMFGQTSKEVALACNNMVCALGDQDKYDEAAPLMQRAKAVAVELGLQHHKLWTSILTNSGNVHRALGKIDEAEKELLQGLRLREQEKSEQLHESYLFLGMLYRDKQDFEKAKGYFQKCLKIKEKRFGLDHPKVGKALKEYAVLLRATGWESDAVEMEKRAQAIKDKVYSDGL